MSSFPKHKADGFVRLFSPRRTVAGHRPRGDGSSSYNAEVTLMRTLVLYSMH